MLVLKDFIFSIIKDTRESLVFQEKELNNLLSDAEEKVPTWRRDRWKERRIEVSSQIKLLKKIEEAVDEFSKKGEKK